MIRILFALLALMLGPAQGQAPYRIVLDADMSHLRQAGNSILWGMQTALAQSGGKLGGLPCEIVVKDHRRNTFRSTVHVEEAIADKRTLCLFGGVHSPPLLAARDKINQGGLLTLVPWAAAGPITRASPGHTNWIFRCSVDDTNAGAFLSAQAKRAGWKRVHLLLEETGWGRTNEKTIGIAIEQRGLESTGTTFFPWHLGATAASQYVDQIHGLNPDGILLVANEPEAAVLIHALMEHDRKIPVISHWGITAGRFQEKLAPAVRKAIHLRFIQTSFSFHSEPKNPAFQKVLALATKTIPEIRTAQDIEAPVGFLHAYDLMRILNAAAEQAKLTGNGPRDRAALRNALEDLKVPVHGLVKTYTKPFRSYAPGSDAHEALRLGDLRLAHYDENGLILVDGTSGVPDAK